MRVRTSPALRALPAGSPKRRTSPRSLALALVLALAVAAAAQGFTPPPPPGMPEAIGAPPAPSPILPVAAPPVPNGVPPGEATPPAGDPILHERLGCLPSSRISALALADPLLYVGSPDRGVAALDIESRDVIAIYDRTNVLPKDDCRALFFNGPLWVGTGNGLFKLLPGRPPVLLAEYHFKGGPQSDVVQAIAALPHTEKYLVATPDGLFTFEERKDGPQQEPRRVDTTTANALGQVRTLKPHVEFHENASPDCMILVAADNGVALTRDCAFFEPAEPGEPNFAAPASDVDRRDEAHTLAATLPGLACHLGTFRPRAVKADGLPENWLTACAFAPVSVRSGLRDGPFDGIWAGTKNAGLAFGDGERFRILDRASGRLTDNRITCLVASGRAVYAGTVGGGLNRYAVPRPLETKAFGMIDRFPAIRRLAVHGQSLYVATAGGVSTIVDGQLDPAGFLCRKEGNLPSDDVRDLGFDAFGGPVVLVGDAGACRPDPDGHRNHPEPPGFIKIPSRRIVGFFDIPGFGPHFLMDGVYARVLGKIGRFEGDGMLAGLARPFLDADVDATGILPDRPVAARFDAERRFIALAARNPLAMAEEGRWRIVEDPPLSGVTAFLPLGARRTVIGTSKGLAFRDDGGWSFETGTRGISLLNVVALAADPEIPESFFIACNPPGGGGLLARYAGGQLEARELPDPIVDLKCIPPLVYIACADKVLLLPTEGLPHEMRGVLGRRSFPEDPRR